jgi:dCTP deaminase
MRLLVDHEITSALQNPVGNALAYVLDGDPPHATQIGNTQIQPSSLDLTIGKIFIPGTPSNEMGGSNNGKNEHNLDQGHTAVIRTREAIRMGPNRSAIAFPPSRTSLRGLLMTNPGHIDPGYEGPLHCTVINMGRETFALNRGERIMRVLFFELDNANQASPAEPMGAITNQISPELLARLSVDFLDVEKRAQSIANAAVRASTIRASIIGALVPIAVGLLTLAVTAFYSPLQSIRDDITRLRCRPSALVGQNGLIV